MISLIKFTNMKTLFICLMLICSSLTFAQEKGADSNRRDKIEQLKIAYIAKELNLTPNDSEKFWPLYNEMDGKMTQLRKSSKKAGQELKQKIEVLKDEEIKKKMNLIFENESQIGLVKKEYFERISNVIGAKKASKLVYLEQQFKRELLKRLKQRENKGQGNGDRPGPRQRSN